MTKNVSKPLAKSTSVPLVLRAPASATNATVKRKLMVRVQQF